MMAQRKSLRIEHVLSPIARWLGRHGVYLRIVWPKLILVPSSRNLFGDYRSLSLSILRILLQIDHLAARIDATASVASDIAELRRSGHIRLDSDSCIVGALGLSLRPTVHEQSINGSILWALCVFDVIGIFGALRTNETTDGLGIFSKIDWIAE